MKTIVDTLMKLQEVDNRLNELKLQKGDLPALIEHLDEDLKGKRSEEDELEVMLSRLHGERMLFEKEVEASKLQLAKYESKLYQVQNNREYDAISTEIDGKKVEIEGLENRILQTLEDEEQLKKKYTDTKDALVNLDGRLQQNMQELEEIHSFTQEEEDRLMNQREGIAEQLEKRYLSQYERIRKAKSGIAVVPITRGSCGGCFSALPPQFIVEIREINRLNTCEYCGRILIWSDEITTNGKKV